MTIELLGHADLTISIKRQVELLAGDTEIANLLPIESISARRHDIPAQLYPWHTYYKTINEDVRTQLTRLLGALALAYPKDQPRQFYDDPPHNTLQTFRQMTSAKFMDRFHLDLGHNLSKDSLKFLTETGFFKD